MHALNNAQLVELKEKARKANAPVRTGLMYDVELHRLRGLLTR